jgi:carbamate kinase
MGPKVEAACRFAKATGKAAAIGALADLERILAGQAGTTISVAEGGFTCATTGPLAGAARR